MTNGSDIDRDQQDDVLLHHLTGRDLELEKFQVNYSQVDSIHGSDVSNSAWLSTTMHPDSTAKGKHRVKVVLAERNSRLAADLVLTDIELIVRYVA